MFNKYGNLIGNFVAASHYLTSEMFLKQVRIYNDDSKRLEIAKNIICAAIHNMRSNLRYYNKIRHSEKLTELITKMSDNISLAKATNNINEMMMVEARNRQQYYQSFNEIVQSEDFTFRIRTKRPPKDEINAMISFGNVCLYRRIATEIYKHQIDIRIGFLHSTNRRAESLNLDIAELFKPIIVDRTIFTLINKGMISKNGDFEETDNEGVYLSKSGKRVFLQEYQNKLYQKLTYNEQQMTYDTLIRK